jgi:hypothetical protein
VNNISVFGERPFYITLPYAVYHRMAMSIPGPYFWKLLCQVDLVDRRVWQG